MRFGCCLLPAATHHCCQGGWLGNVARTQSQPPKLGMGVCTVHTSPLAEAEQGLVRFKPCVLLACAECSTE
jgi:hypothetical protein